ncbi:fungal cellulose binding domain-containing protein [Mollisia scopiformis]|uniref:lytic cellulose monooxygenase (C4-dehydrogenating) n=1 Tax=Mollisia scopiformis TaxID=149040 RepID=A0A132B5P7_MOLSC|nr:fungal cellulose binding domain-containing protein [Mollisia scopiformis]KUJ07736.1 fungal cellulose binding domain-containing protein [Mollisia scopiformis]
MKFSIVCSALVAVANAHYTFPALIANGATTTEWEYVRQWTGFQSNGPVTDVSSLNIRCNVGASTKQAPGIMTVAAGSTVGFTAKADISHPGPMLWYMAKVPEGKTAATWDGSGDVWFKIYQDGPNFRRKRASLPAGDYLIRVEHIALHSAQASGGAQFYLSCGQLTVTGGGSGTPIPFVAFPGAYKASDPGIMINIYYPVPTSYTPPGPAVWTG